GAVTHAQNWTQRANTLDFSISDGGVNIQLPANQNEAPVGYYMLFLVNDQGTPSIAEWIRATPNIQLDGDFNHDDVVDAADYTVWRDNLDGQYTEADYELWKNNFGMSAGAAAVAESSHAVPEASGIALFAAALVHLGCVRRSRR
ncbi:MAG: galactose oxidase early set domain-containing protein, partial [Pirellulales bacterium]